jgi:hypothetical protein
MGDRIQVPEGIRVKKVGGNVPYNVTGDRWRDRVTVRSRHICRGTRGSLAAAVCRESHINMWIK